jgi:hypothetical protein
MKYSLGASQIKFCGWFNLVTTSDDVWYYTGSDGWQMAPSFPACGGTATEKSSWGEIKREFRGPAK